MQSHQSVNAKNPKATVITTSQGSAHNSQSQGMKFIVPQGSLDQVRAPTQYTYSNAPPKQSYYEGKFGKHE